MRNLPFRWARETWGGYVCEVDGPEHDAKFKLVIEKDGDGWGYSCGRPEHKAVVIQRERKRDMLRARMTSS